MNFTRTAELKENRIPHTIINFLLYFGKKFKSHIIFLIITAILYATCQTLFPYFIKLIINVAYQASGNKDSIVAHIQYPVLILCCLWITTQIVSNIQGIYIFKIMPHVKSTIKQTLFSLVLNYQYEFFTNFSSESINKKINDIAYSVEKILQFFILNILSIFTSLFITIIILLFVSPLFSIIMISWLILHIFNGYYFIRKGIQLEEQYVKSLQTASSFMGDVLSNIMNVNLFNMCKIESKNLSDIHSKEVDNYRIVISHFEKMRLFQSFFSIFLIILNILTLFYLLNNNLIFIGDFIMVLILSVTIINFVWYGSIQLTALIRELGILKSNINLINYNQIQSSNYLINHHSYNRLRSVRFENVSFTYKDNLPVLNGLSLAINPGDKVGIIGRSGLGKTTLLKLLLGIYTHSSGSILIGKYNIKNIEKRFIYDNVTVITQEAKLLNRSIKENIKYGNTEATDEEMINASKMACCHEFILKLPDGYNTIIGENGIKFSGGQRQRIALARMIARNSPIVIMDEPSSALDSLTEELICQNIYEYLSNKTVLIVSHKSAFLKLVNKIYKFENGNLQLIEFPHSQEQFLAYKN